MSLFIYLVMSLLALIFIFMYKGYRTQERNKKILQNYNIPLIQSEFKEFLHLITGKSTFIETEKALYRKAKGFENCPIVANPDMSGDGYAIYITDLNLLKTITVKAFDHFMNRRPVASQQSNLYFQKMLVSAKDEQWKGIRVKLSPSFTTGKIKRMFQIFKKSSENISSYLKNHIDPNGMDLDLSEILSKYTMDVIASCAFAIDSKAWEVPFGKVSKFEKMANNFQFSFKPLNLLKFIILAAAPKVADLFGLEVLDKEAQIYFSELIRQVVKHRRQTGDRQEDFVQLMMDAQTGQLKADEQDTKLVMHGSLEKDDKEIADDSSLKINSKLIFDDDDLVANAMLFLIAGFDTTLSLLLFAIYSLAVEPQVQEKLFDEVSKKMEGNDGKLTYESVQSMTYLDMVINETLRQYSPASRTERCCTKDYPVPGTNFVIKKGTIIIIPIYSIQNDERYYEDPDKFIPERFTAENKEARNPYSFIPFGSGPRNCIGMRFAQIEVKSVLAQLVYNFRFLPCTKTKIPIEFSQAVNLKPKDGLWMKSVPR